MYTVEQKPIIRQHWKRTTNPLTAQLRKLAVGESFIVSKDDPNWTGSQVRNENRRSHARYAIVKEGEDLRFGRVE